MPTQRSGTLPQYKTYILIKILSQAQIPEGEELRKQFDHVLGPLVNNIEKIVRQSQLEVANIVIHQTNSYMTTLGSNVVRLISDHLGANTQANIRYPPLLVRPDIHQVLRELFPGQLSLTFKSVQQAELVESARHPEHVLCVCPTGHGKTIGIFGAAILKPKCLFVVITPLVALTADLFRRLCSTRITGGVWPQLGDVPDPRVVIVSAHRAAEPEFISFCKNSSHRLARIFFDEAHHLYTSAYRAKVFDLLHLLTTLAVPITFLSATIFPRSVSFLCESMHVDVRLLRVIRMPTYRPNIQYTVQRCTDQDALMDALQNKFSTITLAPHERGLIYCTTVAACQTVSNLLAIPYYTSTIVNDDPVANSNLKTELSHAWRFAQKINATTSQIERSPNLQWMVATLCFGQGIDHEHVRWAIHVEIQNAMDFLQESGRIGRDGKKAYSHTFYTDMPWTTIGEAGDHQGVQAARDFLGSP